MVTPWRIRKTIEFVAWLAMAIAGTSTFVTHDSLPWKAVGIVCAIISTGKIADIWGELWDGPDNSS